MILVLPIDYFSFFGLTVLLRSGCSGCFFFLFLPLKASSSSACFFSWIAVTVKIAKHNAQLRHIIFVSKVHFSMNPMTNITRNPAQRTALKYIVNCLLSISILLFSPAGRVFSKIQNADFTKKCQSTFALTPFHISCQRQQHEFVASFCQPACKQQCRFLCILNYSSSLQSSSFCENAQRIAPNTMTMIPHAP